MIKIIQIISVLLLLVAVACNNNKPSHTGHTNEETAKVYTCPMHPQVIKDKPGKCPVCGMDLVEKKN